jgi:hypothetical protein
MIDSGRAGEGGFKNTNGTLFLVIDFLIDSVDGQKTYCNGGDDKDNHDKSMCSFDGNNANSH